jgi:hypothetical protein
VEFSSRNKHFGDITAFALDLNPSIDVGGLFRAYFNIGVAMVMQENVDDTDFFWNFTPYIRRSLGIGDLYFGFSIWNGAPRMSGDGDILWNPLPYVMGSASTERINFAVPVYFEISF